MDKICSEFIQVKLYPSYFSLGFGQFQLEMEHFKVEMVRFKPGLNRTWLEMDGIPFDLWENSLVRWVPTGIRRKASRNPARQA